MFAEVQPVVALTRGADTPDSRTETAQVLKQCGCRYVRYEARGDGSMAALGFGVEAVNAEPL